MIVPGRRVAAVALLVAVAVTAVVVVAVVEVGVVLWAATGSPMP